MTSGLKVGVLGGGQLARMLGAAGVPLGLEFVFLDPSPEACARRYGELIVSDWPSAVEQDALLACDRLTCDFENVPAEVLEALAAVRPVRPGPQAFASAQDRLVEKRLLTELGIPVPGFAAVSSRSELQAAVAELGLPAVLKTRRMGYDGKGQFVLRTTEDMELAWRQLGDQPLLLESWVPFQHECAISAVRSAAGEIRHYPLSWTLHDGGILALALAPSAVPDSLEHQARELVSRLLEALDYVGCLTLELFATQDGLLANEFAPRVHNSAHWTIEGAVTSQFENHLRAVCDWPLGDTALRGPVLMLNWVGELPEPTQLLAVPGLRWHDYGKAPRPGRKLGHATLIADTREELAERVAQLRALLPARFGSLLARLPAGLAPAA